MPQKKRKATGLGDRNLLLLWRKAILYMFGGKCFFCESPGRVLECHHTVKRRNFLLRYDYRNGIPVCKWAHSGNAPFKMSCHQYAETPSGKHLISEFQAQWRDYLTDRSGQAKQWLVEHGMTKDQYKQKMYDELNLITKDGWRGYGCYLNVLRKVKNATKRSS